MNKTLIRLSTRQLRVIPEPLTRLPGSGESCRAFAVVLAA